MMRAIPVFILVASAGMLADSTCNPSKTGDPDDSGWYDTDDNSGGDDGSSSGSGGGGGGGGGYECESNYDFLEVTIEEVGRSNELDLLDVGGDYECGEILIEAKLCADVGNEGMSRISDGSDRTGGTSGGKFSIELTLGDLDDILDPDESVEACVELEDEDGERLRILFDLSSDYSDTFDDDDWDWGEDCPC